jgi:uncharacterized protein (TIGR02001 family)
MARVLLRAELNTFFTQEKSVELKIAQKMVLAALAVSGAAFAQTKAPEPDYTLSYNVGVVTDYRYRGVSQSSRKAALQGGADFSHKSGFYLGTWGSTIDWIRDDAKLFALNPGATDAGNTRVEIDLYGGYKGTAGAVGYDVGVLQYWYPGNKYGNIVGGANANTTEVYGAVTFGPVTAKYSHSLSNTFGFADSKNSYYVDLSATFDLGSGFSLVPHVGYQDINNASAASYTDWSLTVAKDMGNGFSASLAYVDTDTDFYVTSRGKDRGKAMLVGGLKYSF